MRKNIFIFLLVFIVLISANAAGKWKIKDNFSAEWTDNTLPANRGTGDEGNLGWGGFDNYFQWESDADIYKGDKFRANFSFWNGWDMWYAIESEKLDVEIEFNNSLNFFIGDFYTFTLGFRPVGKVALFENASTNYIHFTHAYFESSLENIIKIPKIMDFHVKGYYRHKLATDKRVVGNVAMLFAIGSPGIWTGDVFRAYHIWDPTGAWQMGFKNNCGVWPMYSFGFGWMFNSIVQLDLDYKYARDWETGAQAEFQDEQYSELQKTHVKMYLGVIQNLSKLAGIKGFDIILKAEQAIDMEMPFATGTEMTKTIYTLGYYGIQLGWNGLNWDLMATLCTRDTWDQTRPLQKDYPELGWQLQRGAWQNPSAQLGFATKLQYTAGHFFVYGQYIGYAEVRKVDAVSSGGEMIIRRDQIWTNYIKLGLGFSGF